MNSVVDVMMYALSIPVVVIVMVDGMLYELVIPVVVIRLLLVFEADVDFIALCEVGDGYNFE